MESLVGPVASNLLGTTIMRLLVLPLLSCVACSTPLSTISDATVHIDVFNGVGDLDGNQPVSVFVGAPGCPSVGADVTLDGAPFVMTRRGERWNEEGQCIDTGYALADRSIRAPGTTSMLEIVDDSAAWTIEVVDLRAASLVLAGAPTTATRHATITSPTASAIMSARITLRDGSGTSARIWATNQGIAIRGNTIELDIDDDLAGTVLAIAAQWKREPTSCVGPSRCDITITEYSEWPISIGSR